MSKFKVGDKVKVLRAFTDDECGCGWVNIMEACVGEVGEIMEIHHRGYIDVEFTRTCSWWFPPFVLEKVED